MALALNNGYPRVDVESLLFDVKELLRTSLQVCYKWSLIYIKP